MSRKLPTIISDDDRAAGLSIEQIQKLQAYGRRLLKEYSPAEVRKACSIYETQLLAETQAEIAPADMTEQERAAANLERAHAGLDPLEPAQASERKTLTAQQIASINFDRACLGQAPLSIDEISRMNIREAMDPAPEVAPKGMHPAKLAAENLRRACSGEQPMIAADGDE